MTVLGKRTKAGPRTVGRIAKIAVVTLLGVMLPAGALFAAQTAKPSFSVQVSPASLSIAQGSAAAYTVTVTSQNGFSGAVAMTASSLPAAATAGFSPSTFQLNAGATATSTLTVTTAASTPVGTSSVQVVGTSGKTSASTTAGLTVNYPLSSSFTISSAPNSVSVAPGSTGVYSLSISRTSLAGPISLSASGLPAGVTASFSPNPATGASATLQLTASSSAASGTSTIGIVGAGADANGKMQFGYANISFQVLSNGKAFTISGDAAAPLAPGVSKPVGLAFSNTNNQGISATNLSVTVSGVTRTQAAIAKNLPCSVADFAVTQYSGPYPLALPSGSSTLGSLSVPMGQWPQLAMLDTSANQDGCKGATITLAYSGSGQGN